MQWHDIQFNKNVLPSDRFNTFKKLSYAAIVHIQILVHVTEQKQLPQHYK